MFIENKIMNTYGKNHSDNFDCFNVISVPVRNARITILRGSCNKFLSLTMKDRGHTNETLHTFNTFIWNMRGIDISLLTLLTAFPEVY